MRATDRREFLKRALCLTLPARVPLQDGAAIPTPEHVPGHAAVYVYTRPLVLPRHQALVTRALARRSEAHTSGWAADARLEPRLAIGPVVGGALFSGTRHKGAIDRAWPFVAVFEYDLANRPRAFLDWYRRPDDATGDAGWMLDPSVGYAAHIDAELATAKRDGLGMMALCDTPTGSHVGGSQWVVRGRVTWADGRRSHKGWWLDFAAAAALPVAAWRVLQTPLVPWRVASTSARGISATRPVENPEHELAVFGTDRVFSLPPPPGNLTPGPDR